MPASVEILNIPIGSILTSTISGNDKEDKNDFDVLLLFSENVNLTQAGVSVSLGSIVAFEGVKSVYKVTIRPPQTAGTVQVTVAANAVSQGNTETSKDIRVSTGPLDDDAESLTELFTQSVGSSGIAVTPSRIVISSGSNTQLLLNKFTYDGTLQSSEQSVYNGRGASSLDYVNGEYLTSFRQNVFRYREDGDTLIELENFGISATAFIAGVTHTKLGITAELNRSLVTIPYGKTIADRVGHSITEFSTNDQKLTHQDDIIYGLTHFYNPNRGRFWNLVINDDDTISFLKYLNIGTPAAGNFRDIAIYRDTLYAIAGNGVYTLDIRKYRPIAKNTKSTIYPVFAEEGDTIDLKQFSPDAERIVFDVGYDLQPNLSINTNNQLTVGSGTQTCLVKLKAINRIGATETESFGFYLIVRRATAPVWRNVSELTMRANSSYDLFQLVDAESIAFRSGRSRLAGSSLSNGMFRVGTVGGVAEFTARKGSLSGSHIAIAIDVVQGMGAESSEVSGYRVEIAGIDVTADVLAFPSVSETLDPIVINEYRVNEASVTLRNAGGKYNSDLAGNFWEMNRLNAGGFQNAVKIFLEYIDGSESLHFSGVVNESFVPIKGATFKMNCSDISSRLRKALVQSFGTLDKWDALRKQSDEDSYEGVYVPERSLVPMQIGTGKARSDRTDLEISRLALPSEGPAAENTGYMTSTEFRTAGGFLDENPLLGFKAEHRSEDVRFLIHQLAINKEVYNTEIDIPGVTVEDPFLLNRGSVAFSVEQTRTTRLPVDWVQGVQGAGTLPNTILILLSNPEHHISDQLVQYDVSSDAYRVLHTFDKGIAVHRIERRTATNYSILTSEKITQDRSARELPRHIDATGYAFDSVAEGSEIKIYHYNSNSDTVTEHVAEDDSFPPQLGLHYWVGFENPLYIDDFEGIVPGPYSAFKWQSGNLYYRYAKAGEFGVARVNTGGATTQMIGQAAGGYQDHLNFAFDINSSGSIYMVYASLATFGSVTVVNSTSLRGDGSVVIADDLSSYDLPLQLQIDARARDAGYIDITGVDTEGTPISISQRIHVTSNTLRISFDEIFASVTSVEKRDFALSGTFMITTHPVETTELTIKRRTSSGTESVVLRSFKGFDAVTDLDDAGGVYLGCHECVFHNNHLYLLVPIGRVAENSGEYSLSRTKAAGMVLFRCDVTAGSPSLTVLDKWDYVHQAGCNLVVHDGAVHYTEQPRAAMAFKPINPDLEGYWTDEEQTETMGYNVLPESLGALKRINTSGEVEDLGNVWHSEQPYNIFPTRMLSIDNALHLCAGYGNGDEVLRYNSLASQADNMVHIVYGKTLHYVLPRFQSSGSVYAALASLAKSVNATLSFEKNVVMITDRRPARALTDGATGTGTGNLSFSDANKAFPSSGYLLIGKEILKYSGISGGTFTGIARGVLGSSIENHVDDSKILYLDNLIQTEKLGSPYKAITLQADVNRIFNIIRDSGGIAEVRDEESIALYGERPYTLELGLTRHEKAWIEEIFRSYLEELSTLQQIVNIQVRPDFSLRLGQIVPIFYKGLVSGMRIVSVRYEGRTTHIKGRTV